MEIVSAAESSDVQIAVEFLKPFKSSSTTAFELSAEGAATSVTWKMIGPITPMVRVMSIFRSMDKMIGPDFDKGLEQLKAVAERSGT